MDDRRSPQNDPPDLIELHFAGRSFAFILDHLVWLDQKGRSLTLRFFHGEYIITFQEEALCQAAHAFVLEAWREFLRGRSR